MSCCYFALCLMETVSSGLVLPRGSRKIRWPMPLQQAAASDTWFKISLVLFFILSASLPHLGIWAFWFVSLSRKTLKERSCACRFCIAVWGQRRTRVFSCESAAHASCCWYVRPDRPVVGMIGKRQPASQLCLSQVLSAVSYRSSCSLETRLSFVPPPPPPPPKIKSK